MLRWGDVPQRRVMTLAVVDEFDVLNNRCLSHNL